MNNFIRIFLLFTCSLISVSFVLLLYSRYQGFDFIEAMKLFEIIPIVIILTTLSAPLPFLIWAENGKWQSLDGSSDESAVLVYTAFYTAIPILLAFWPPDPSELQEMNINGRVPFATALFVLVFTQAGINAIHIRLLKSHVPGGKAYERRMQKFVDNFLGK